MTHYENIIKKNFPGHFLDWNDGPTISRVSGRMSQGNP